ncbi:TerB family tellurite resistance protein [Beijerinckia sp. L45]|uniref:tellurite resistance TerB family protein n=1 Tax=Beijerinckia sp. L45 TaxID=1641855 RepID=UPI00131B67B9|nr:TerB family tellurite resistance protein [Beijerinckia sp. L45]
MSIFDSLRNFIADTTGRTATAAAFEDGDYRLATVALLVHVANVDGMVDPLERQRLREIIEARFGLDAATTTQLIEAAEQSDREAVDFFHFTTVLKRELDDDGRHKIIEMMWDVVFADGTVTEFEENVVWRVAELLGVSTRDRVMLRQKVAEEPRPEAAVDGPWSSPASSKA